MHRYERWSRYRQKRKSGTEKEDSVMIFKKKMKEA